MECRYGVKDKTLVIPVFTISTARNAMAVSQRLHIGGCATGLFRALHESSAIVYEIRNEQALSYSLITLIFSLLRFPVNDKTYMPGARCATSIRAVPFSILNVARDLPRKSIHDAE
jgi:hypothetical protein